ncbi:uncharacterized protein LOC126317490 [Schistocerca gregaria]|uniref:uncharacterized protein LOC126317490 n=1 Tax=Schistocerca gregaria TaxID=7010 RepID=UPI00211E7C00|nr:uncharacterized protein LOC126317490 [Schistocerca gregaria]
MAASNFYVSLPVDPSDLCLKGFAQTKEATFEEADMNTLSADNGLADGTQRNGVENDFQPIDRVESTTNKKIAPTSAAYEYSRESMLLMYRKDFTLTDDFEHQQSITTEESLLPVAFVTPSDVPNDRYHHGSTYRDSHHTAAREGGRGEFKRFNRPFKAAAEGKGWSAGGPRVPVAVDGGVNEQTARKKHGKQQQVGADGHLYAESTGAKWGRGPLSSRGGTGEHRWIVGDMWKGQHENLEAGNEDSRSGDVKSLRPHKHPTNNRSSIFELENSRRTKAGRGGESVHREYNQGARKNLPPLQYHLPLAQDPGTNFSRHAEERGAEVLDSSKPGTPSQTKSGNQWYYLDMKKTVQGPWCDVKMNEWLPYFQYSLLVSRSPNGPWTPIGQLFIEMGKNPFTDCPIETYLKEGEDSELKFQVHQEYQNLTGKSVISSSPRSVMQMPSIKSADEEAHEKRKYVPADSAMGETLKVEELFGEDSNNARWTTKQQSLPVVDQSNMYYLNQQRYQQQQMYTMQLQQHFHQFQMQLQQCQPSSFQPTTQPPLTPKSMPQRTISSGVPITSDFSMHEQQSPHYSIASQPLLTPFSNASPSESSEQTGYSVPQNRQDCLRVDLNNHAASRPVSSSTASPQPWPSTAFDRVVVSNRGESQQLDGSDSAIVTSCEGRTLFSRAQVTGDSNSSLNAEKPLGGRTNEPQRDELLPSSPNSATGKTNDHSSDRRYLPLPVKNLTRSVASSDSSHSSETVHAPMEQPLPKAKPPSLYEIQQEELRRKKVEAALQEAKKSQKPPSQQLPKQSHATWNLPDTVSGGASESTTKVKSKSLREIQEEEQRAIAELEKQMEATKIKGPTHSSGFQGWNKVSSATPAQDEKNGIYFSSSDFPSLKSAMSKQSTTPPTHKQMPTTWSSVAASGGKLKKQPAKTKTSPVEGFWDYES